MHQPSKVQRYMVAAFVVLLAVVISPFGIATLTSRANLSFRVTAASGCISVFLLLIGGGILSRSRVRRVFLHAVFWALPFALLSCSEIAAIAMHLSDRVSSLEDLSPLAPDNRFPNYLLSPARMYVRDGMQLYRPYEGDGIRINEIGLRTAPPIPKGAGEWRVAITGGSTTWGSRVVDADRISEQFAKNCSCAWPEQGHGVQFRH